MQPEGPLQVVTSVDTGDGLDGSGKNCYPYGRLQNPFSWLQMEQPLAAERLCINDLHPPA